MTTNELKFSWTSPTADEVEIYRVDRELLSAESDYLEVIERDTEPTGDLWSWLAVANGKRMFGSCPNRMEAMQKAEQSYLAAG